MSNFKDFVLDDQIRPITADEARIFGTRVAKCVLPKPCPEGFDVHADVSVEDKAKVDEVLRMVGLK